MGATDEGIPITRPVRPKENSDNPVSVLNGSRKRKRTNENHRVHKNKSTGATKAPDQDDASRHVSTPATQPSHPPSLSAKREALYKFRSQLPIWSSADNIQQQLKKNNILILVGETGSGKSTQVPQFLVHEKWCKGAIAVTQPRRVAAISLARRVADEMGSPLGSSSPASKVGYSVRFDNSVSPNTRIKYLTEGMLLQEMLRDPALKAYSVVIVDEVHERSVNVDLILGFLKNLLATGMTARKGQPLKVVVMSATADVAALVNFFNHGSENANSADSTNLDALDRVATCQIQGRLFPVKMNYLSEPTQDFVEEALKTIFQIHYKESLPGDILVFLTGQDTVESLERLVNEYAESMGPEVPRVGCLIWEVILTNKHCRYWPFLFLQRCHKQHNRRFFNQLLSKREKSSYQPISQKHQLRFREYDMSLIAVK